MQNNVKVMIFIDGSNLFYGLRNFNLANNSHYRIDLNKLVDMLANDQHLVRKIFYTSLPPEPKPEQIKFIDFLQKSNFQVIERTLKITVDPSGKKKTHEKGLDVALVTDLLVYAYENAYDEAIIISGDADYGPAIDRILSKGKNIQIITFRNTFSKELAKKSAKIVFLDDLMSIFEEKTTH